jgi:phosphohistidine phosphatase
MELFIIRHAAAEDGPDDAVRPLSDPGRKRFKETVAGLMHLDVKFDQLLHSPKLRAAETAELLRPLAKEKMESTPLLEGAPSTELLELLRGPVVAVVGHEPHLSALLAWLVTGDTALGKAFELKKGAVARLEGTSTPGGMCLRALLPPSVARRVR